MRKIDLNIVTKKVRDACIDINTNIDKSILKIIKDCKLNEKDDLPISILDDIITNSIIAKEENIPLCQDTGLVVVFLEIGNEIVYDGNIYDAINKGVSKGYKEGYLRKSIVSHPINRINTLDNTPAIIHTTITEGDKLKLKIATKGGGSENMSTVIMLTPADGYEGIVSTVLEFVKNAGGKPCPPIIVGIGIGGNLEKSALIAKESILRDINDSSNDEISAKLEKELYTKINELNIGPMGVGGKTTCLAVKVNTHPCHIAQLPLAINIQCHSSRHTEVII